MRLNKKQRERLLRENCGAVHEDDAIDPRHYLFNKRKSRNKHRKVFQLCRQVADTLAFVLVNNDRELEGLSVVDVLPAPDARKLLVIVAMPSDWVVDSGSELNAKLSCLQEQVPRLRAEIARSINRSKTPQLVFELARLT